MTHWLQQSLAAAGELAYVESIHLSDSWLNMAESIQRIIIRRALAVPRLSRAAPWPVSAWGRSPKPSGYSKQRSADGIVARPCSCGVVGVRRVAIVRAHDDRLIAWVGLAQLCCNRYAETR